LGQRKSLVTCRIWNGEERGKKIKTGPLGEGPDRESKKGMERNKESARAAKKGKKGRQNWKNDTRRKKVFNVVVTVLKHNYPGGAKRGKKNR